MTINGGSGSFVILWSGLWKLTTAAAIPYHTGIYHGPRGFGFITIGANVDEFHKAATQTSKTISTISGTFQKELEEQSQFTRGHIERALGQTTTEITLSTLCMICLVVFVAIWMASILTQKITGIIHGIRLFQSGNLDHRLPIESGDEFGQLAAAFNAMSNDIQRLITTLRCAEERYRSFFENATEGIFRSTVDGRLVDVNPAFARLFGFTSTKTMMEQVTSIGEQMYVNPARRKELIQILQEQGTVRNFEYEIIRLDGIVRSLHVSCHCLEGEYGEKYLEGVVTDFTERNQAIQALEEAKEKAEQLSAMKSNFLSMVSHELRTPLTSIIGFAKMIRKFLSRALPYEQFQDADLAKVLQRIQDNTRVIVSEGDRLTELINNVLDLAKLETGRFEWNFANISIENVLEHSAAATAVLFEKKNVAFTLEYADNLPPVVADHDRLMQVCINLLSNAAKFTEQGSVSFRASMEENDIVVRVRDTGVGVREQEIDDMFDKFRQLGNTLTDKPKGSGLGLPICKEIIEHHGGKIWYESAPGGGSIFAFSIPCDSATRASQ